MSEGVVCDGNIVLPHRGHTDVIDCKRIQSIIYIRIGERDKLLKIVRRRNHGHVNGQTYTRWTLAELMYLAVKYEVVKGKGRRSKN